MPISSKPEPLPTGPARLRVWLGHGLMRLRSLVPRRAAVRCPTCALDLSRSELYKRIGVCERCSHHFPITARQRIELIADPRSFEELDKKLTMRPPPTGSGVTIADTYPKKLKEAQRETHLQEAVVVGYAAIEEQPIILIVLDFRFMGGSMGAWGGRSAKKSRWRSSAPPAKVCRPWR
ncbi:MAG: hypothetical protein HY259_02630 [Chloroflexi bacterium]|nr:hypothetical protein [Chloroflexota bacterium]